MKYETKGSMHDKRSRSGFYTHEYKSLGVDQYRPYKGKVYINQQTNAPRCVPMDWKKLLPIFGVILLIYILWRFNIEKILSVFSTINPLYAALCFLGIPIILFVINIQWQMILKRQCIHVSFTYSLKNLLIGYFYGFITPGGFGAYLRALYLKYESKAPHPKMHL